MKTPALIAIIACLHIVAVGSFLFIQGCGTHQRAAVEPPPAPILPPEQPPRTVMQSSLPAPVFQPPVPVEQAPAVKDWQPGDTYVVQKGDTLSGIAKKCGLSTRELAELNGLKNPNQVRVGQKLLLPSVGTGKPAAAAPAAKPAPAPVAVAPGSAYVVQKGDSLSKIAARYGTSVKDLRAANSLKSDTILIGQKLSIPGSAAPKPAASAPAPAPAPAPVKVPAPVSQMAPPPPPAAEPVEVSAPAPAPDSSTIYEEAFEYTVSEEDTLDSIARDFVVLKEDLIRANNIKDPENIRPGSKLIIPIASP